MLNYVKMIMEFSEYIQSDLAFMVLVTDTACMML